MHGTDRRQVTRSGIDVIDNGKRPERRIQVEGEHTRRFGPTLIEGAHGGSPNGLPASCRATGPRGRKAPGLLLDEVTESHLTATRIDARLERVVADAAPGRPLTVDSLDPAS